jgi:hypothetical protein
MTFRFVALDSRFVGAGWPLVRSVLAAEPGRAIVSSGSVPV